MTGEAHAANSDTADRFTLPMGWSYGISNDDYHADLAFSSTFIKRVHAATPAHAKAEREQPVRETAALTEGSALHHLVGEPDTFTDRYVVGPEGDGRTKAVKAALAELEAEHPGATILRPDVYQRIHAEADSLRRHPMHALLFNGGAAEVSGRFDDPVTGLPCRIRPDYLHRENRVIVDLKSAVEASGGAFQRAVVRFGYHVQAAFYADGFRAITGEACDDFVFFVVEKTPPFACAAYRLDDTAMQLGRRQYRAALNTIAECVEHDHWPAYSQHLEPITLPDWAFNLEITNEDF